MLKLLKRALVQAVVPILIEAAARKLTKQQVDERLREDTEPKR